MIDTKVAFGVKPVLVKRVAQAALQRILDAWDGRVPVPLPHAPQPTIDLAQPDGIRVGFPVGFIGGGGNPVVREALDVLQTLKHACTGPQDYTQILGPDTGALLKLALKRLGGNLPGDEWKGEEPGEGHDE